MAKLLVFDDQIAYREQFEGCLKAKNAVTFVNSIADALALLSRDKFDMVLANVHQDNEPVFELLQEIRMKFVLQLIPVLCVRDPHATELQPMDEAFQMATLMVGACGYISTNDYVELSNQVQQYLKTHYFVSPRAVHTV